VLRRLEINNHSIGTFLHIRPQASSTDTSIYFIACNADSIHKHQVLCIIKKTFTELKTAALHFSPMMERNNMMGKREVKVIPCGLLFVPYSPFF
jgi:hypothetical protein